jgi:glycosyltransferase involved in cell wall biosynthesis
MPYPKVSVVISTYNRPERLDTALASVHAQTFGDFEVIVVDDCSPQQDAVRDVMEKWYNALEQRGVELIAMRLGENSGYQCMPKNRGVEMARGDYIAYLDDDNTWRPDHLSTCVEAIEADFSTDMVYTRLCYHMEDPKIREELFEKFGRHVYPEGDGSGVDWNPQLLSQMNYVDTSSILHSKGAFWRLVRENGYGWDETMRRFGDWNFVWRWATFGLTGKLVNKVTVDYNVHRGSIQITRPAVEVPICLNFNQYQALRKDRNRELLAVS